MRVPLSWLRDFAPFDGDPTDLAAVLDDLGLVVEGIEKVGEDLGDVVVARVLDISPISGADKIRRVVVDAGGTHGGTGSSRVSEDSGTVPGAHVQVVCGARNFEIGDLVALAPVGAVLPGAFSIRRRTMKGVVSEGMLCSGRELELSDDDAGIMVLGEEHGAYPGQPIIDALGIDADVVFDVSVEANRPDAWCIAGVARDLAARLDIPFAIPPIGEGVVEGATGGPPLEALATVRVEDPELCPRFAARVVTGVQVGPSPKWMRRRLGLAGMRPINNVVDASNYVMLELGQPTHPYDLDRLGGGGLLVRRARGGEKISTLDGVVRELGRPGPGLGETGQDCLICDAGNMPVGIAGIMGGQSSEIQDDTTRVLLEAAYFVPMAIARTSHRLNLRTEASARFERGCDPQGLERALDRFCELLVATGGSAVTVAGGTIDLRSDVPVPLELAVRVSKVNALLGTAFSRHKVAKLLAPLGIHSEPGGDDVGAPGGADRIDLLQVTVPTFRPDIRPLPAGEADIAEEVARTYGYSRLARRAPAWSMPGRLTDFQRERRKLKDLLCGLSAFEAWTPTFVDEFDQSMSGSHPPYVEVVNPLVDAERFLRSSMVPGLVRALAYNAERRQGGLRLFEVGSVFCCPEDQPDDPERGATAQTSQRLSAVFCAESDDAWMAVAAWRAVADALRIADWSMVAHAGPAMKVMHPYRSSGITSTSGGAARRGPSADTDFTADADLIGVVGELDPFIVGSLGLLGRDGRPPRVGWLDLDLEVLLDRQRVPRRSERALPVSRFPSSDLDLAFSVSDEVPAESVERVLRRSGGEALESLELFDVYRGAPVEEGARSLAYRLRFCALDRTLGEQELAALRARCISAVEEGGRAKLR